MPGKIRLLVLLGLMACSARAEEPLVSLVITGGTDAASGDIVVLSADARGLNAAGAAALSKTKIVWTSGGRVLQEGGRFVVNLSNSGVYNVVALLVMTEGGHKVVLQTARHTVDFAAQRAAIAATRKKMSDEIEKRTAEDKQRQQEEADRKLAAERAEKDQLAADAARLADEKKKAELAAEDTAKQLAAANASDAADKQRLQEEADKKLAAEKAEKDQLAADAARLADEKKKAELAAEDAAKQLAAETAEKDQLAANVARMADEKKTADIAAEDAAKQLAAEKAEKDRLSAEVARMADEKKRADLAATNASDAADKQRLQEEADKKLAAEKAEKDQLAADAARLADEKQKAELAAEDAGKQLAAEKAQKEQVAANAALMADEKKKADVAAEETAKQLAAEKAEKEQLSAEVDRLTDENKQAEAAAATARDAADKQRQQEEADKRLALEKAGKDQFAADAARVAEEKKQADIMAAKTREADETANQLAEAKADKERLAAQVEQLAQEKKDADAAAGKAQAVAEQQRQQEDADKRLAVEKAEKQRQDSEAAAQTVQKAASVPAPAAPPAIAYTVSVTGPKPEGRLPRMWDADKRKMVDVSDRIAVFQDLTFTASVSPAPAKDPHYEWTIQPAGVSTRSAFTRELRARANSTGMFAVAVTVRDAHDAVLGSASTSLTVAISSADLEWSVAAQEADAQLTRAKALVAKGQLDEGLEMANGAAKLDPKSEDAQATAGQWLNERKTVLEQLAVSRTWMVKMDYERAQNEWAKANALQPQYPPVQELEDELQALKKTLDRAQAWVNEGYALEKSGKDAAAIAKYEAALNLAPDDKLAARIADLKKKQAEADAQKLIDEGYALEKSGDTAGAIACYEKTYALFPDDRVVGHVNALKSK